MKFQYIAIACLLAGTASCKEDADPSNLIVEVTNPGDSAVDGVPVVVPLTGLDSIRGAVVTDIDNPDAVIPWQLDDLDGDGVYDELAFAVGLAPNQVRNISVRLTQEESARQFEPTSRAYIKLRDDKMRHPEVTAVTYPGNSVNAHIYDTLYGHGACVESLTGAWRVYIDNRQSIDLYGKPAPKLELDSTGFYTTRAQFLEQGYGRDILWAGRSVAAGSFRGLTDGEPQTIDTVRTRSQRVLASGPVRAIVEVEDKGWTINGKEVDMVQRYTQYGVNPWFTVDVSLDGPGADQTFCTGVLKIGEPAGSDKNAPNEERAGFIDERGFAASWGENIPDKADLDLTETLGIAIRVNPANVAATREDDINYIVELKPDADGRISYDVNFASKMNPASPQTWDEWKSRAEQWAVAPRPTVVIRPADTKK